MNQIKALELVTAPAAPVLTTSEAKSYLRVDSSTDDTLIDSLVAAATYKVEFYLNKKLITQTWKMWLDAFPYKEKNIWWDGWQEGSITQLAGYAPYLELPLGPLQSITHFKTYDDADTAATWSSAEYFVDTKKGHGRVYVRDGYSWPSVDLRIANAIEIQFVVGYGTASSNIPAPILSAVREMLAVLYDCRGASEIDMPYTAKAMLDPYRFINLRHAKASRLQTLVR